MKTIRNTYLAALAVLLSPMAANAVPIDNTTGLTGDFVTETFDTNNGNDSLAGSQFAGVTFGPKVWVTSGYGFLDSGGSQLANFDSRGCGNNGGCDAMTIFTFDGVLSAAAFAMITNSQLTTFSAYLNSVLVESFSTNTSTSGGYYGFTGILFDSIYYNGPGTSNDAFVIDNMQWTVAAVPEPGTLALLGLGLAGIGFAKRKKA